VLVIFELLFLTQEQTLLRMPLNQTSWIPGQSGNLRGAPNQRISRYVKLVVQRLLKGREIERVYGQLKPHEQALFVLGLLRCGLESEKLEGDLNALESMPEDIYLEFKEFLRSRHQTIRIEDGTKEGESAA
jgi:hypothetical protein